MAGLRHPNIVGLIDSGETEEGTPYLVLELVDGTAIDRFCAEQRWSLRQRLGLMLDVCAAVTHAHQRQLLHLDLKPENVLVTRKGAVRAAKGTMGIIPGSMGAKSFIVRGLGNAESFDSCSHGAGRVMSRTQAKKEVSLEEHVADTAGVECRKDEGVIDETPKAYKPIEKVMAAQSDLVEIVHTLKQVVCVKG